MSKLDELLKGIDVEWKTLGEVCEIIRGVRVTKKDLIENGKYPVVSGGTGYMGFVNEYNREENSITIAQYGTAGFVKWQNEKFWANDVAFTIYPINEDILLKRFLYYFLINKQNYLYEISNKIAVPFSISKEKILQIKIPIAPIEIQREIVRVLDELTSLTNQLTTELETERQNRKKQFEFFRTAYLNNQDNEIKWLKLGNLGKFTYGLAASASDFGNTRFVRISDINAKGKLIKEDIKYVNLSDDNKKYLLKKNDLLMARTGATFGKTMIFDEDYDAIYAGFLIKLDLDKNSILPKYYWHFAQSELFWEQANKLVNGGGQPQFNANTLKNVQVPIPFFNNPEKSLAEQERIVKLLDQFDATHTAIEEEITKEIKLRTQQYEYYREKLLSFPSLRTT
ncbi:restriction endonuclease subunit S [Empedobacter falsenii]